MVQEVAKSCKTITPPPSGHGRLYNHPLQDGDEVGPTHDTEERSPTRPETLTLLRSLQKPNRGTQRTQSGDLPGTVTSYKTGEQDGPRESLNWTMKHNL